MSSFDQTPQNDENERRRQWQLELYKLLLRGNTYAFILVVLILVAGAVISAVSINAGDKETAMDIWKSIIPIITAYLGYVFGSRNKDNDSE